MIFEKPIIKYDETNFSYVIIGDVKKDQEQTRYTATIDQDLEYLSDFINDLIKDTADYFNALPSSFSFGGVTGSIAAFAFEAHLRIETEALRQ